MECTFLFSVYFTSSMPKTNPILESFLRKKKSRTSNACASSKSSKYSLCVLRALKAAKNSWRVGRERKISVRNPIFQKVLEITVKSNRYKALLKSVCKLRNYFKNHYSFRFSIYLQFWQERRSGVLQNKIPFQLQDVINTGIAIVALS